MKTIELILTFDQYQDSIQGAGTSFGEGLLDAAKATVTDGRRVIIQAEGFDGKPYQFTTFNTLEEIKDGWEDAMRRVAAIYEEQWNKIKQSNQAPSQNSK